jgi:hypothetical protein
MTLRLCVDCDASCREANEIYFLVSEDMVNGRRIFVRMRVEGHWAANFA